MKSIPIPPSLSTRTLPLEPLTPVAFASFGTVITTPSTSGISVNQGSATKHPRVSPFLSTYPSGVHSSPEPLPKPTSTSSSSSSSSSSATSPLATPNINIFTCQPRTLTPSGDYICSILERHPYTTQSFIPLPGPLVAPGEQGGRFIVIVAPTRPDDGMPDLEGLRAFEVKPGEAKGVTYGVGTWHAPMVVVGGRAVRFVVVVHENGVKGMDVEEVLVGGEGRGVRVGVEMGRGLWKSKL